MVVGKRIFAKYQLKKKKRATEFGKNLENSCLQEQSEIEEYHVLQQNLFRAKSDAGGENRELISVLQNENLDNQNKLSKLEEIFPEVFLKKFSILFKHKKRKGLSTNSKDIINAEG